MKGIIHKKFELRKHTDYLFYSSNTGNQISVSAPSGYVSPTFNANINGISK